MENQNRNYYVFRISYEEPYYSLLKKSIQQGVLRQGWGMYKPGLTSMDISEDLGHFLTAWRENFVDDATEKGMSSKYNQLRIMLEFKVGDILVVPKVPNWHEFWVLEVTEPYSFQKEGRAFKGDSIEDFKHRIGVKMRCQVAYINSSNSRTISAKFRSYQSCINRVYNEDFISAVEDILQTETAQLSSESKELVDLDIWENTAFYELAKSLLTQICNWSPHSTEVIVRRLFEKNGFTCTNTNKYDSKGGDIDLLFNMPTENILGDAISMNDNQSAGLPEVHVQVKKKSGKDSDDVNGVQQLIDMIDENTPAINILLSTVDEFSQECRKLAKTHEVLLIDGIQFAKLLVKYGIEGEAPT